MRSQVPPICTHCHSIKSPLWRRGANMEVLCNACGLYWKHHNAYRPLVLKAAADRKSSLVNLKGADFNTDNHRSRYHFPTSNHLPMTYMKPSQFSIIKGGEFSRKSSGMRSSNILLNSDDGHVRRGLSDLVLPPLLDYMKYANSHQSNKTDHSFQLNKTDHSFLNHSANEQRITAAQVLPNLKNVLDCLSVSSPLDPKTFRSIGGNENKSAKLLHSNTTASKSNGISTKYIINQGMAVYQGDHVSIRGTDSQVYYAVLIDFWLTEVGRSYCIFRWLLPSAKWSPSSPLQFRFDPGPLHERVEAMDSVLSVFYSPYRDGISSERIRKSFLFSSMASEGPETASESLSSLAVEPPAHLVQIMMAVNDQNKSLTKSSEKFDFDPASSSVPASISTSIPSNSPSKSAAAPSPSAGIQKGSVIANPAESSEIAAKMLLSMN